MRVSGLEKSMTFWLSGLKERMPLIRSCCLAGILGERAAAAAVRGRSGGGERASVGGRWRGRGLSLQLVTTHLFDGAHLALLSTRRLGVGLTTKACWALYGAGGARACREREREGVGFF